MSAAQMMESDEAFARRLQAQEMGIQGLEQTPLMLERLATTTNNNNNNNNNNRNRNPTVINARLNELSSARATVCAILTVNTPQIIATMVVLALHWNDPLICDVAHAERWKWWAAISALRMMGYSAVVVFIHMFKVWLDEHPNESALVTNTKNMIDAFGLIWFITGNMWLFADDDLGCRHPERSPVYKLCMSLLIINYIQICLPCIVAVLMIPVFCFCMPCLIRVLARLHDPRAQQQGATDDIIATLPLVIISRDHLRQNLGEENACAICLNEMVLGEEARILQCKHLFHKQCVDEWLRVNATCPTCRMSVLSGSGGGGGGGGGTSGGNVDSSGGYSGTDTSASSSGGAAATGASAMVRRGSDTSSRQGQGHRLVTLMNFEVDDNPVSNTATNTNSRR